MNLETIITHYRNRLAALPDAILIGEIPEGAKNISSEVLQLIAPMHNDFLKLCNGGSFGDIIPLIVIYKGANNSPLQDQITTSYFILTQDKIAFTKSHRLMGFLYLL